MGSFGPMELALIFLVVLLVFGAKRIPEIARGLGKGIREFKTATKEISNEFTVDDRNQRLQPPAPPAYGSPAPRETTQSAPSAQQAETPRPAEGA